MWTYIIPFVSDIKTISALLLTDKFLSPRCLEHWNQNLTFLWPDISFEFRSDEPSEADCIDSRKGKCAKIVKPALRTAAGVVLKRANDPAQSKSKRQGKGGKGAGGLQSIIAAKMKLSGGFVEMEPWAFGGEISIEIEGVNNDLSMHGQTLFDFRNHDHDNTVRCCNDNRGLVPGEAGVYFNVLGGKVERGGLGGGKYVGNEFEIKERATFR